MKAILFDLDGVLVNACEWHYLSLNKALKTVVNYEISREDHINKFNGLPTKIKLNMLNITGESFERVWKLKQDYTIETIQENKKIDLEKIEFLSYLKDKNIKIACVTNSIRETASLMLEVTGQLAFIDLLISNEDAIPKPNPDPYNKAIADLKPELSIGVEDSSIGIKSLSDSNVNVIWKVKDSFEVNKTNFLNIFGW